jgi:hypothetical protein
MATTTHKAYTQTLVNDLSVATANATNSAASAAIDNTTNLDLFMDAELVATAAAAARSTGANIALYLAIALDGTNYADINETTAELVAVYPLDAATTARRLTVRDIPIPPALFKLFLRNNTGQALGAATLIGHRTHSVTTA